MRDEFSCKLLEIEGAHYEAYLIFAVGRLKACFWNAAGLDFYSGRVNASQYLAFRQVNHLNLNGSRELSFSRCFLRES